MCDFNQNRELDAAIIKGGIDLIRMAMEAYLRVNEPANDRLTQALENADVSEVIAFAYQAMKNGKLTREQYEKIFDVAMRSSTVRTTATSEPSWNQQYLAANAFLNQFRR